MTCGFKVGGGGRCGGTLDFTTDSIGRVIERCQRCERRRAGICQDCPKAVDGTVGKALRCAGCRRKKLLDNGLNWRQRDPEHTRAVKRDIDRRQRDKRRGGPPMPKDEQYRKLGLARAAALTPERRKEIAVKAIRTRWARAKARAA